MIFVYKKFACVQSCTVPVCTTSLLFSPLTLGSGCMHGYHYECLPESALLDLSLHPFQQRSIRGIFSFYFVTLYFCSSLIVIGIVLMVILPSV